ncbi:MAG TPA: hypothetical protein VG267_19360 [Terracidiphilus sp.]|jgi:hypothetical protein|nr:hypothetical protein [Terracidiphilus sp.]
MKQLTVGSALHASSSIACVLLIGWATANAQTSSAPANSPEPRTYRCGLKSIVVPPPTSDLNELGSDYRVLMESAVPDTNRLIAAFLPAEDAANVRAGISKAVARYAMIETLRRAEFVDVDSDTLKQVANSVAQQYGANLGASMTDQQEELNHKLRAMRGSSTTITLDKPLQLGVFFSKPDSVGFGAIMPLSAAGTTVKMIVGMTILRVQDRLIYAYIYANYKDDDSIQWVRKTSEQWADSILKAN